MLVPEGRALSFVSCHMEPQQPRQPQALVGSDRLWLSRNPTLNLVCGGQIITIIKLTPLVLILLFRARNSSNYMQFICKIIILCYLDFKDH